MVLQQAGFLQARRVLLLEVTSGHIHLTAKCSKSPGSHRGRHEEGAQRSGLHCWMGRTMRKEFMRGGGEEQRRLPGKESASTWAGRG